MAPKNKFTREEMIAAALKIVRRSGTGSLTAKAIADELGISTRPVFTCFGTMDTVKNEVRQAAEEIYNGYIGEGLKENPVFRSGHAVHSFCKGGTGALQTAVFNADSRRKQRSISVYGALAGNSKRLACKNI